VEEAARFAAQGAAVAALSSTIASLVRTELTRGIIASAVGVGLLLLGISLAFAVAAVSTPSTTVDAPIPVAAQPELPKPKLGPLHARVVDLQGKAAPGVEVLVFEWPDGVSKVKTDHDGRVVRDRPRPDEWF